MSKRVLVSSIVGVVVLGGVAAGGLAMAYGATEPTVANGSARYVAPSDGSAGALTFTADVSDDSGVRGLKVIAWPVSSKLDPTEDDLRDVESAVCRSVSAEKARCTYTVKVTAAEAAELPRGSWHVSALATAKDGGTAFVSRAAVFDVTR
ncbi:DUF5707 domain-containing protein [Streptomyces cacaoi]|uniref:Uncharacterized protein n=1 Tax=Streptomyces asoensis TaxID=249586 RepID=A0A6M4WSN1_9ACTN|nr:DUF5707 domain-containing protein [Streptomyces asoensis]QJT02932.1 hypothetical protein G9272_23745 [Streptomyces asoensis]